MAIFVYEIPQAGAGPVSPPTTVLFAAANVTSTALTLSGSVNPNGDATTYYFEYGLTGAYGSTTTPASAGSGVSAVNVSANVSGLLPNTLYYYRLVATNSGGTTNSTGGTVTTSISPPTPGGTTLGDGTIGLQTRAEEPEFTDKIMGKENQKNQPILTILNADMYSRTEFATLNDSEFTELLSSIEGIGVSEFFVLYEELADQIPSGSLDVGFQDTEEARSIFRQMDSAAIQLRQALTVAPPDVVAEIIVNVKDLLLQVNDKVITMMSLLSNAEPKTHAYLVEKSAMRVITLTRQFQSLFNYLIMLNNAYQQLLDDYNALLRENEELKKQITQLNDLILKLTAPDSSGFQIVPDAFTVDTVGPTWIAGQSVEITVCGSAKYSFQTSSLFAGIFTWKQVEGTSRWVIQTSTKAVGKIAYITATSDEVTRIGKPTEQIVFVFPPAPEPPKPAILISSAGTNIVLHLPDDTSDTEAFVIQGWKSAITSTITGGTPPYTVRVNVPTGNTFFTAKFQDTPGLEV